MEVKSDISRYNDKSLSITRNMRYILMISMILIMILSSCVTEFEVKNENDVNKLVLLSFLSPSDVMRIKITKTITTVNSVIFSPEEFKGLIVEVSINNCEYFEMSIDSTNYMSHIPAYYYDYVPQEGDSIKIRVTDSNGKFATIYGETVIPPSPIIEYIEYYKDIRNYSYSRDSVEVDSVAVVTYKISDKSGPNFYHISITNKGTPFSPAIEYIDPIFHNSKYNIFKDTTFDGTSYYFTIEVRLHRFSDNFISATLHSITSELFEYLISMETAEKKEDDIFSEPYHIFSNLSNGKGIFGSYSSTSMEIKIPVHDIYQYVKNY